MRQGEAGANGTKERALVNADCQYSMRQTLGVIMLCCCDSQVERLTAHFRSQAAGRGATPAVGAAGHPTARGRPSVVYLSIRIFFGSREQGTKTIVFFCSQLSAHLLSHDFRELPFPVMKTI